jgi:hypothetical protein
VKRPAKVDKIDINKDRIYRLSDPIQLACIFFPSKNAKSKRAAFLAIFFEIRGSLSMRVATTDHVAKKYNLSPSSVTKARAKMVRVGLIRRRQGYWQFSTVFTKSLENLAQKLAAYQIPPNSEDEREKERFFVELAQGCSCR